MLGPGKPVRNLESNNESRKILLLELILIYLNSFKTIHVWGTKIILISIVYIVNVYTYLYLLYLSNHIKNRNEKKKNNKLS